MATPGNQRPRLREQHFPLIDALRAKAFCYDEIPSLGQTEPPELGLHGATFVQRDLAVGPVVPKPSAMQLAGEVPRPVLGHANPA
jgi:hypothetical protein